MVAETFAVAWRRRADMPADADEVRPWLFGIARRCLANAARSTHRAGRLGMRLADSLAHASVADPSTLHENRAESRLVRAALEQLSTRRPRTRDADRLGRPDPRPGGQRPRPVGGHRSRPAAPGPHPAARRPAPPPHTSRRPTVITDRELDAQLAGAAGVHDAELPALPDDFLALVRADTATSGRARTGVGHRRPPARRRRTRRAHRGTAAPPPSRADGRPARRPGGARRRRGLDDGRRRRPVRPHRDAARSA